MKAKELRIGNLITYGKFRSEGVGDVEVFHLDTDEDNDTINYIRSDRYEPILLTEHWLDDLGFVKGKIVAGSCMMEVVTHSLNGEFAWYFDNFKYVPLDYVHQLQNLYFTLTGTELEISK